MPKPGKTPKRKPAISASDFIVPAGKSPASKIARQAEKALQAGFKDHPVLRGGEVSLKRLGAYYREKILQLERENYNYASRLYNAINEDLLLTRSQKILLIRALKNKVGIIVPKPRKINRTF